MNEVEKPSIFERLNNWAKKSISLKLFSIGILALILLIPSSMLTSLISEREYIRNEAINEVSSKWGGDQIVGGPVLSIPYKILVKDDQGRVESKIRYAHFLPEKLNITGTINPEKRYRGIYVVVLYNTLLHVNGNFSFPKLSELNIPEEDFMLKDAFISLGITDMKGIKDDIIFKLNDNLHHFNPGIPTDDIFGSGVSLLANLTKQEQYNFSFDLNLNGSSNLSFLPFGKETQVSIHSPWNNPSFEGTFLPDSRTVDEKGFTATWKVLQLNRNYPQQGLGSFVSTHSQSRNYAISDETSTNTQAQASEFGVKLLLPIDEYQKTMRSTKYNSMFIFITFLAFFFVEVLNRKRVHPIQYLLVGFAICLFYILLLSLSEHIKFDYAYLVGCLSILALMIFYTKSIFKSNKVTLLISGILVVLYGFFYSLLQLQDYALLMGSIGLLIILATIMYLTRNINWYSVSSEEKPNIQL